MVFAVFAETRTPKNRRFFSEHKLLSRIRFGGFFAGGLNNIGPTINYIGSI